MEKIGKSSDQKQENLRQKKRTWNAAAKIFIQKLIETKKGLNGRGSQKLNIPPSNIQNPLPGEFSSALNELAANFQQLTEAALKIEQEQAEYSRTRRKPMKEQAPTNVAEPIR
jgi:hypothetical protein